MYLSILMTVLWFLVAISILVAVHEFGHFYVARRMGVKVLRFSIGFGPRLFSFRDRTNTEFALSAIPLGGYVKMLDEREADVAEQERHLSYNSKSVGARIAIAVAGPAANIVLAFVFYWALLIKGTVIFAPVIGTVEPNSLAEQAGLASGQEIVSVDGKATPSRRDVAMALIHRLGETGEIQVAAKYPGDSFTYESAIKIDRWMQGIEAPDPMAGLGMRFFSPPIGTSIDSVQKGSAAEQAGIRVRDEVIAVDGKAITKWDELVDVIQTRPEQNVELEVIRAGETLALTLVPRAKTRNGKVQGFAGIGAKSPAMPEAMWRVHRATLLEALIGAAQETKDSAVFVFVSMKKLVLSHISVKNLSGPIGIAQVAADHAQYGFWAFISFMASISVVLAVINMLPIPTLDGGHILFCLIEWLKGGPLSERVQVISYQAGMALILCVMVLAFYNDILRLS